MPGVLGVTSMQKPSTTHRSQLSHAILPEPSQLARAGRLAGLVNSRANVDVGSNASASRFGTRLEVNLSNPTFVWGGQRNESIDNSAEHAEAPTLGEMPWNNIMASPTAVRDPWWPRWPPEPPSHIFVLANNDKLDDEYIDRLAREECEDRTCAAVLCNHAAKKSRVLSAFPNVYWMSRLNPFRRDEGWDFHINGGYDLRESHGEASLVFLIGNTRTENRGLDEEALSDSDTPELLENEEVLTESFGWHYRLNESDVWQQMMPNGMSVGPSDPLPRGQTLSTGAIAILYWMHAMPNATIFPVGFTHAHSTEPDPLDPDPVHDYSWEWEQFESAPRFDGTFNSPDPYLHLGAFRSCPSCLVSKSRKLDAHKWLRGSSNLLSVVSNRSGSQSLT